MRVFIAASVRALYRLVHQKMPFATNIGYCKKLCMAAAHCRRGGSVPIICYKEVEKKKHVWSHCGKKCPHEESSGKEETREIYLICGYICCVRLIVMLDKIK